MQQNLGRVIPASGGNWNSTTSYAPITYVKFNNAFYLSKIQNINKQPDLSIAEWQVVLDINTYVNDIEQATIDANMAISSIANIVDEFDNKVNLPVGGTTNQFIRGDGSIIDLAYGQFTISDNYIVPNPDETSIIPIDTDIVINNIILDKANHYIKITQPGVYNISLNVTVLNKNEEHSVIHIYDMKNNHPIASSLYNHVNEREHTLNCSLLNYFNSGDEIGFYIEYSNSPKIIFNRPTYYDPKPGFNPILTLVNIQQIK